MFLFFIPSLLTDMFTVNCRNVDLRFVESPALAPPEVQIDMAAQAQ